MIYQLGKKLYKLVLCRINLEHLSLAQPGNLISVESFIKLRPFLERQCVDYVQSDPVWCGGISEWLKVCDLVRRYPGVKVVPHITSPWITAPHCVASQPEDLCPLLEFNYEGGRRALLGRMTRSPQGQMHFTMPQEHGIS